MHNKRKVSWEFARQFEWFDAEVEVQISRDELSEVSQGRISTLRENPLSVTIERSLVTYTRGGRDNSPTVDEITLNKKDNILYDEELRAFYIETKKRTIKITLN